MPKQPEQPDWSELDDIPMETRERKEGEPLTTQEWIDSLPTAPISLDDLVDYPASSGEGEGIAISTRIPIHWLDQIDTIRQLPGTNLPNLWPKRASFFRWCVMQGIITVARMAQHIDSEDPDRKPLDPIVSARIFIEKTGGRLAARSEAMLEAREKVAMIGEACAGLVAMGEDEEAANMINQWIDMARLQETRFWRNFFQQILIEDALMITTLALFVKTGQITDEFIIHKLEGTSLLDLDAEELVDRSQAQSEVREALRIAARK